MLSARQRVPDEVIGAVSTNTSCAEFAVPCCCQPRDKAALCWCGRWLTTGRPNIHHQSVMNMRQRVQYHPSIWCMVGNYKVNGTMNQDWISYIGLKCQVWSELRWMLLPVRLWKWFHNWLVDTKCCAQEGLDSLYGHGQLQVWHWATKLLSDFP